MSELPSLMKTNEPILSHRPQLAAAAADGDQSVLAQNSQLDKGSASSFID